MYRIFLATETLHIPIQEPPRLHQVPSFLHVIHAARP